jgi:hypothetical protein
MCNEIWVDGLVKFHPSSFLQFTHIHAVQMLSYLPQIDHRYTSLPCLSTLEYRAFEVQAIRYLEGMLDNDQNENEFL